MKTTTKITTKTLEGFNLGKGNDVLVSTDLPTNQKSHFVYMQFKKIIDNLLNRS